MNLSSISLSILSLVILCSSCNKEENSSQDFATAHSGLYAVPLFSETEFTFYEDVTYSTRPNFLGIQFTDPINRITELQQSEIEMQMDVVVPTNAAFNARQPLMVLIHGGSLKGGSKRDLINATLSYASAGYVSATINYRLTTDNDLSETLRTTASYHALEDVQNAIRFLKVNADLFYIDINRIALIGVSAGGGLSLGIALSADEIEELSSDFPGTSAGVQCAFCTGITLLSDSLVDLSDLTLDAGDAPLMMFHNSVVDPANGGTWEDALETQVLIENSGNECILIPQPPNTHTVSLHVGSPYWQQMKPFLWRHLRLHELRE